MTVLDSIIAGVREDMEARRSAVPEVEIRERALRATPALDVLPGLRRSETVGLFSEVKRSSPSKGALATIEDPATLARSYEAGGANSISVLTEQRRFGGSLRDLDAVRRAVSIPVLRKDFIVEPYQVYEARAHGADIILLIVAALTDDDLARLLNFTRSLGMRALVETHTEEEIARALATDASIIGVNARNLKTLDVDRDYAASLVRTIPADRIAVAESAVSDISDIHAYAAAGADAVLVGEALVRHAAPEDAVRDFRSVARRSRR